MSIASLPSPVLLSGSVSRPDAARNLEVAQLCFVVLRRLGGFEGDEHLERGGHLHQAIQVEVAQPVDRNCAGFCGAKVISPGRSRSPPSGRR